MEAIRIKGGAIFVYDGMFTVRLSPDGECDTSPITYRALEWDLRTEPENRWEYLTEGDLVNLPDNGYEKILKAFGYIKEVLGPNV